METQVLNKKQQKQTLSAKKTKNKETIKNVLAKPYSSYWPQTNTSDYENLKSLLETNLPCLKEKHLTPPYNEIKHIKKDQRKAYRQEYTAKHLPDARKKSVNEGLICGTNAVTRMLESNPAGVGAILIKENVNQRLLVQHVIDMCILYKTPFVMMRDLNKILSDSCGIGAVCCAIKSDIFPESKLNLIKQAIEAVKYPVPKNHINFNRAVNTEQNNMEEDDDACEKPKKRKQDLVKVDEEAIRNSVYLRRTSTKERVFNPPVSKSSANIVNVNTGSGFLPLSVNYGKTAQYVPLVVNRIKGDVNRNKRKIKSLKSVK